MVVEAEKYKAEIESMSTFSGHGQLPRPHSRGGTLELSFLSSGTCTILPPRMSPYRLDGDVLHLQYFFYLYGILLWCSSSPSRPLDHIVRFPLHRTVVTSLELSFTPPPRIHRHLNCCQTPILAVIVTFLVLADSGPNQSLVFREGGENAKDDRDAGVELDAHKTVGDGFGDVLKVHGFTFDQNADGDYRVEGLGGNFCDHRRWRVGGSGGGCCGA